MRISPISYNNRPNFSGIKERDEFRESAKNVLDELKYITPGSADYVMPTLSEDGIYQPAPQSSLIMTLLKARSVGKRFVTPQDKQLLKECRDAYVRFESRNDIEDPLKTGVEVDVDRKKEVRNFTF